MNPEFLESQGKDKDILFNTREEILKNNKTQRAVFERINEGIITLDADGRITYVNQKTVDLLHEKTSDDLLGKDALKICFNITGNDFINAFQQVLKTKKPVFLENYSKSWNSYYECRIYPEIDGVTIYLSDITDYKIIQRELRDNLDIIEEAQEIAHLGNWQMDVSKEMLQWSDEMYRIHGVLKEEFPHTLDAFLSLVHTEDRKAIMTWINHSKAGTRPGSLEIRIVTPQGNTRWIRCDGKLVIDQEGKSTRMIGTALNITQLKQAEEEISRKHSYLEKVISSSPNIVFILDIEKDYPDFIRFGLKRSLGYSDEEIDAMDGLYPESLIHSNFIDTYRNVIQKKYPELKNGETLEYECQLKNSKGEWRDYFTKEIVFSRNSDGTPTRILGYGMDITNRKKAQEEIREAKLFIESVVNASSDMIYIYDIKKMVNVYVNSRVETYFGYTRDEFQNLGSEINKILFHPDDYKHYIDNIHPAYADLKDDETLEWEYRLKKKDGQWRWFHSKISVYLRDEEGKPVQVIGLLRDVTDLIKDRKVKEALESRFQVALENIANVITIYDKNRRIQYVNPATQLITGLSGDEFVGKRDEEVLPEEIVKVYKKTLEDTYKTRKIQEIEDTLIFPNGRKFHVRITCIPVLDQDGELTEVIGVTQDFTEIKRAEQLLQDSEKRYRLLVENSPYSICVIQNNEIVFVNNTAIELLGAKDQKELLGRPISDIILPNRIAFVKDRLARMMKGEKGLYPIEEHYRRTDGDVITVDLTAAPTLFNGVHAMQIIAVDITEKKKAELELANEAIRRQFLIEKSNDGIIVLDSKGKVIEANLRAAEMLGYTSEEFAKLSVYDWDHYLSHKDLNKLLKTADEEGAIFETIHTRKDGSQIDVEISANGTLFKGKKLIFSVIRDISDRKKAAKELADEALRRRLLIEQSRDGIVVIDESGKVRETNLRFAEMLGYATKEVMTLSVWDWDLSFPKNELVQMLMNVDETGDHFETKHKRKDGTVFDVEISTNGAKFNGEKLIFCVVRDITERKKAQSELYKTLENLRQAIRTTIDALMRTTEIRDPYTAGHQKRVADLSRSIATELGLSPDLIEGISIAASIHDIGKISVPSEILSKPSRLTDLEYTIVKEHPRYGKEILENVSSPWPIADIIYQHHEKMDGSGYPLGLKGDQIKLEARILCVADVVEAMASHRPYRPSLGINVALEEIENHRGVLYDSQVVDVCLKLFREKGFNFKEEDD